LVFENQELIWPTTANTGGQDLESFKIMERRYLMTLPFCCANLACGVHHSCIRGWKSTLALSAKVWA